jgi:hypothetical protein
MVILKAAAMLMAVYRPGRAVAASLEVVDAAAVGKVTAVVAAAEAIPGAGAAAVIPVAVVAVTACAKNQSVFGFQVARH